MKWHNYQVVMRVAAIWLLSATAAAETWQQAVPAPSREQVEQALRLGEQFQQQAPVSREAPTAPRTSIPPAYTARSQSTPRTTHQYNPYYNYCYQYPWAYQCRPYTYRYHWPGIFPTHQWKRHDDHRPHDRHRGHTTGHHWGFPIGK